MSTWGFYQTGALGHGHVRPRPDGGKMRCGGPGMCAQCSAEAGAIYKENIVVADARQRIIDRMLDEEIGCH